MNRQTTHHPPPPRSWKSLITHGYTYVSDLVSSSLGLDDPSTDQAKFEDLVAAQRTKKRKRQPTDEQTTVIYSRLVPDIEGSHHQHSSSSNISFKTTTVPSSSSTAPFRRLSETAIVSDRTGLTSPVSQDVSPLSPTTTKPYGHVSSSTTISAANNVTILPPRNKLRTDSQHVSQLERVIDSLKIKVADVDSKGTIITPRLWKMNPPKTTARQESTLKPCHASENKSEPWAHTHIKKEPLGTTPGRSTTTIAAAARSSPSSIMRPSPMESSSLHQGLLKRRKVLPDHQPPPGFALKHVNGYHKNTMDVIIHQIPQVKLRRTETIRGPDGQWKPNPFWKEIYNNGKRRSRPL